MTTTTRLANMRRDLIEEFTRLPADGNVVEWQRRLATAIIEAEKSTVDANGAELKYHRHLLRVIGDMLAYTLLPSHTLRALSSPAPPASLTGQGENFDFVLQSASQLYHHGFVPIIADLTNLIGVGDIVAWRGDTLVVLECKNTSVPDRVSTSGRTARQRKRGEDLESYLRTSKAEGSDSKIRAAIAAELPEPDWERVQQLLNECEASDQGVASLVLGPDDWLLAFDEKNAGMDNLDELLPDQSHFKLPILASYTELIRNPDYRNRPPSAYPVSAAQRWRLIEGEIFLWRIVDLTQLDTEFVHDETPIRLRAAKTNADLTVEIINDAIDSATLLPPLVEHCIWSPIPLEEMRQFFAGYAREIVDAVQAATEDADFLPPLADGDRVVYATVYRDGTVLTTHLASTQSE